MSTFGQSRISIVYAKRNEQWILISCFWKISWDERDNSDINEEAFGFLKFYIPAFAWIYITKRLKRVAQTTNSSFPLSSSSILSCMYLHLSMAFWFSPKLTQSNTSWILYIPVIMDDEQKLLNRNLVDISIAFLENKCSIGRYTYIYICEFVFCDKCRTRHVQNMKENQYERGKK